MEWFATIVTALAGVFSGLVPAAHEFAHEQIHEQPTVATATVTWVIDGDTIEVELDGTRERVRYLGVDTPEEAHEDGADTECYATDATVRNRELVGGKVVRLVPDTTNRDDYDRLLRYVYVDDTFVNERLVADGAAEVMAIPPDTKHYGTFLDRERAARERDVGLWGACR